MKDWEMVEAREEYDKEIDLGVSGETAQRAAINLPHVEDDAIQGLIRDMAIGNG